MTIPITKPFFGAEEMRAVQLPLESGWVVQGPFVRDFEKRFSAFTRASFSAATSSCTTALHLAVAALDLQPGDDVIVPAFTWVSTANVVEYMGARPVFADVDLETFNIAPAAAAAAVTARTVGMIPVHLFGLCADMNALGELASQRSLWSVEDAACAFGTRSKGRHAGTFGDFGCFSFHPRKSITTGEGGMVTTMRSELHEKVSSLRDHGATKSDRDRHEQSGSFLLASYPYLGYNYRLTDIQGALGCAQIARADVLLAGRARVAERYHELLHGLDWLVLPSTPEGDDHGWQSYVCLFRPEAPSMTNVERLHQRRNALMAVMEKQGIATRQGTHAPVIQEFYANKYGFRPGDFPNAYMADRLSLSLPLYPHMTDAEIEVVVSALRSAIDAA
ncbi:MAG TPA: DegT/DnrJ/EryC1/StrS family aminotransferase [Vicinamibacterales bacterium]|nr:DegT/DnrJ/EryC1/StrS family aminotransferase [Vicinamibacterales bacterium]